MSEQLRESLSAAMDGEADAFELRRVLDEAKQNDALREQWHRFHLVRDLWRQDVEIYYPDLRDAIWEELKQPIEDADTVAQLVLAEDVAGGGQRRSPWLGRITGTAVAVVVAALVMINGGVFEAPQQPVDYAGTEQFVESDLAPVMYQQATALDQQRQYGLMLHHFQQQAMNRAGVVSFVKVATFRSDPLPQQAPTQSAEETPRIP